MSRAAGRLSRLLPLLLTAGLLAFLPAARGAAPPPDLSGLDEDSKAFLEQAAVLITPQEREAFLGLAKEYQRKAFIRRFWQVRDPYPETPGNELQMRWESRADLAREKYGGLTEDRARMMLVFGVPEKVLPSRCSALLPLEVWTYSGTEQVRGSFVLVFLQPQGSVRGPYRLWYPSEGVLALLSPEARPRGLATLDTVAEACPDGRDLAGYLAGALDWGMIEKKLLPQPGVEWLQSFLQGSTDLPQGAAALPARLELSFPGRTGSRTLVQGLVSVPKADARPESFGGQSFYSFQIEGEILYGDDLFESFRYRFSLPEAQAALGGEIPLVFERQLRPGSYTLILRVENSGAGRYFRDQRTVEVPAVEAAAVLPATAPAAGEPGAAPATAPDPLGAAFAEANAAAAPAAGTAAADVTLRLLPPPEGLLVGKVRVEAASTGEGIARVRFELDGKPILTKGKAPWSVELNLGDQPRLRRLRALALSARDEMIAADELLLNAGPHRFSLRLVDPEPGKSYRRSLRAHAEVRVPEGETLARVELFLNDARVATLYQPPFVQPILLPTPGATAFVRAVAYLADGNSAEDLVLVNSPNPAERIDVQLVELYTTVVDRRGRPVEEVAREDLSVLEDGQPQEIRRFERVRDLPIYAGVMIDTSGSMEGRISDAVGGALDFFDSVLKPRDRAAVITFADRPNLAVRFTNDRSRLQASLAGLSAGGNTALYDSIIYALYYFGGIQGKRAIVLLSDGRDEGSRYAYGDALEYARRSGVAFYTVGIHLTTKDADVRQKLEKLADETGGRAFFVDSSGQLKNVYKEVEEELRSQFLIAYQSSGTGPSDKFRSVEVKVGKPGLEAKTLRGYYP